MRITARVRSAAGEHEAFVATEGAEREIAIPPKVGAIGSSANGGELLALALASCYANDVIREAARAGIPIDEVSVAVESTYGAAGEAGTGIRYDVSVVSSADPAVVEQLLRHTDTVAEVHNTLRAGTPVELGAIEISAP